MIRMLLDAYILALIVDSILSFFPEMMKHKWRRLLKKACDYTCDPIRRVMPAHLPFDFSPILVILIIHLIIQLW